MSCKFVYGSGLGGFRVGGSVLGVFFFGKCVFTVLNNEVQHF